MEEKIYPRIKNAILLCLLLLGIQLGIGLIIGVFQLILDISDDSPVSGILYIFTSLISFGVVILIGFKKTKRSFNEVFKLNKVPPFLWVAVTFLTIGLSIVVSDIDNLLQLVLPIPEWFIGIIGTLMAEQPLIISLVYVGLIAALSEELFFRGLILDGFIRNYSKKKSIIISAILFGIIHLNPWQFLTAFIIGLILAWICIETKSILLCIYMHFLNNAGAVIMYRLNDRIPIKGYNVHLPGEFQPIWFTLSGLLFLSIGILLMIKNIKKDSYEASRETIE